MADIELSLRFAKCDLLMNSSNGDLDALRESEVLFHLVYDDTLTNSNCRPLDGAIELSFSSGDVRVVVTFIGPVETVAAWSHLTRRCL